MLKSLRNKNHNDANASVVDGKLILSFPEAITPIVWQMDLNDAKSSSFEVTNDGDHFALVTKKQGAQKKESIAPFSTKEQAVAALMATSSALKTATAIFIRQERHNLRRQYRSRSIICNPIRRKAKAAAENGPSPYYAFWLSAFSS